MAEGAVRAILSVVFISRLVAGITIGGSAFVNVIDMTVGARRLDVFAGQLEGRQVMVESGRKPASSGMAAIAVCTQQARMRVLIGMTGGAAGGSAFDDLIDVTTGAGRAGVFPGQWEMSVVEFGRLPIQAGMALGAIRTKLPVMLIILCMAGSAVGGSALVDLIDMAALTGCSGMLALQLERSQFMVECGRGPAGGFVTVRTVRSEPVRMRVIFGVAGSTIGWGGTQGSQRRGVLVALFTGNRGVQPGQLERDFVMVEVVPVGINAIVATQAVIPIGLQVRLHEIGLDLLVAVRTNGLVHPGEVLFMAIRTRKGSAMILGIVGSSGKTKSVVGNIDLLKISQGGLSAFMIGMAVLADQAVIIFL